MGTVWCEPYQVDVTNAIVAGKNSLKVEITSTWFNRLAYDAGQPENKRKTWTISGPDKDAPLRNSGLLGPVTCSTAVAQADTMYRILRFTSSHTSFPDTARANGHLDGDHAFMTMAGHYDDSSVLLVIPRQFKPGRKIDMIFWFHGWHNNIDSALVFYRLASSSPEAGATLFLYCRKLPKMPPTAMAANYNRAGCSGDWLTMSWKNLKPKGW